MLLRNLLKIESMILRKVKSKVETLLLKGKPVSDTIRSGLEPRVKSLNEDGIVPQLAAIIIGDDPASQVYVRNKSRAFDKLNCKSHTYQLEADSNEQDVLVLIDTLNHDEEHPHCASHIAIRKSNVITGIKSRPPRN